MSEHVIGALHVDDEIHVAWCEAEGGRRERLWCNRRQQEILELLARRPGMCFGPEQLLDRPELVKPYISMLRRALPPGVALQCDREAGYYLEHRR